MSNDEIIEMAMKSGARQMVSSLTHPKGPVTALKFDLDSDALEAFAKLVEDAAFKRWAAQTKLAVQDEREACAKLVEVSDELEDWEIICGSDGRELLNAMANAIRARGEV